jgi:hypothetical protein
MLVRPLRPGDMELAMILMGYYQDELELNEVWDSDCAVSGVKHFASHSDCCCLIAVEGSRVVGILLGNAKQEFYNKNLATAIQLLYLLPSHRTDENYQQLYGEFVNWSVKVNSKKIMLMDISDQTQRLHDIADVLGLDSQLFKIYTKDMK